MASRSAMLPSTMRCMMEPCSSSDRLRWDTRGVDSLVAGEGSTPLSHLWRSISSRVARFLGSRCSMWAMRLKGVTKKDQRHEGTKGKIRALFWTPGSFRRLLLKSCPNHILLLVYTNAVHLLRVALHTVLAAETRVTRFKWGRPDKKQYADTNTHLLFAHTKLSSKKYWLICLHLPFFFISVNIVQG